MSIGIILMPIRIRIWIGINMETRVLIGIQTMQIHNSVTNRALSLRKLVLLLMQIRSKFKLSKTIFKQKFFGA